MSDGRTIGKSINPRKRIDDLQNGTPLDLDLVHQIATDDMEWLERLWHRKFAALCIRGEWFLLGNEDVARFTRVALWNQDSLPVQGVVINDPWYGEPV